MRGGHSAATSGQPSSVRPLDERDRCSPALPRWRTAPARRPGGGGRRRPRHEQAAGDDRQGRARHRLRATRRPARRRSPTSTATPGILRYRGYPIDQLAEQVQLPRGHLPADLRRAADRRPAGRVRPAASAGTPCCTRTSSSSSTASRATRTRCRCCPRRSAPCRPSTRTRWTPSTRSRWRSPPCACWRSCRPSRPTPTRSRSASRSSTRTTPAGWSRTSCG